MIGVPLQAAHMDTSIFHDDCAWLETWPGPPIGDEEGELISRALGNKNSVLLAHHGQLAAGATVEEAAIRAMFIERAARLQLLAMAAGKIQPLPWPTRRTGFTCGFTAPGRTSNASSTPIRPIVRRCP